MLPLAAQHAGGDVSLLARYEQQGALYYDTNGRRIGDMLTHFKQQGWTMMRLRLFVDPSNATPTERGEGVVQDLAYVKALGARIKAAGFKLMLDFHYSDTWADPAKQFTPAAWVGQSDEELNKTIYNYTHACLQEMVDAGATPDYIQTGNEVSYGMLWGAKDAPASSLKKCYTASDTHWSRFAALLKSASQACREVCPQARIVIHTERVASPSTLDGIYTRLASHEVDYDAIGLSYYPYFHGDLSKLEAALNRLNTRFPSKEVLIVEAGYYHAYQPQVTYDLSTTYPISDDGQLAFTQALIATLKRHTQVTALLWWWPEANEKGLNWNTQRVTDSWYNAGLWDNATGRARKSVAALGTYAGCNALPGDIDGNRAVDINDVNILINIMLTGNDTTNGNADIDDNGTIDITDLNTLLNLIQGK